MFVPRTFIIAGIALIAISLGASGHGLWWLIGLVWALGWTHNGRRACHVGRGRHDRREDRREDRRQDRRQDRLHDQAGSTTPPAAQPADVPDPTHDRHEAFPVR